MAHPHVELAQQLLAWSRTGDDRTGVFDDGKRKGYIIKSGEAWVLSEKGKEFIAKWTSRLHKQGVAA